MRFPYRDTWIKYCYCEILFKLKRRMPRKRCVPACKGNYSARPKVSVFLFPRDEDLKEKWIKAIHPDEIVPSKLWPVNYISSPLLQRVLLQCMTLRVTVHKPTTNP